MTGVCGVTVMFHGQPGVSTGHGGLTVRIGHVHGWNDLGGHSHGRNVTVMHGLNWLGGQGFNTLCGAPTCCSAPPTPAAANCGCCCIVIAHSATLGHGGAEGICRPQPGASVRWQRGVLTVCRHGTFCDGMQAGNCDGWTHATVPPIIPGPGAPTPA